MRPSHPQSTAVFQALGTVGIWGATFVATKVALREVSPATVVWLRFSVGIVILGLAARARNDLSAPPRRHWPMLALLGFIGVALHQWLQANGLTTAAATTTAWLVATTPIFIALLGWMALRERLTWVQWCGIGVGALGVLTILSRGNFASLLVSAPSDPGDILVLLSAPNWAVYTILSRRVLSEISPSKMIFYVMLVGWLFITLWTFGFGPGLSQVGALTWRGWIAVGGLGIFGSGLAYIMYHDALRVLPAPQLGVFLNLEPLVTLLLAAPVLGEPLNFIVLLGGGLIVAGIYLVNRRRSGSQAGEVVGSVEIEDKQ